MKLLYKNIVIAVLCAVLLALLLPKFGCNPNIKETDTHTLDSLQTIIQSKELREMELEYMIEKKDYSIDSISKVKQKVVKQIIKEKETVEKLPLDDAMIYLSKHISFDNNFPHKRIVNFDTAVLINRKQLTDINMIIVDRNGCKEVLKQTESQLESLEQKDSLNTELIKTMNEEDSIKEQQIDDLKGNLLVEKNNVSKLNRKLKFRKYFSTLKESIMTGMIIYFAIK